MYCPASLPIRPAKYSRQSAPEAASATSVSCRGLPVSSDSKTDSSWLRCRMSSAARCSTRPRSAGGVLRQTARPLRRCRHRLFDRGGVGGPQAGDHRAIGGMDALELRSVTVDERAVDEMTAGRLGTHRASFAKACNRDAKRAGGDCHRPDRSRCERKSARLDLDLDVDTGRQLDALQAVDRLGVRVDDVDQPLVDAHLEVLT